MSDQTTHRISRLMSVMTMLQVLSLLAFIGLLLTLARVFHHQSENTFTGFLDFMLSFQMTFPPLVILAFTYGFALLAGRQISEVPADVMSFFRNTFFQSKKLMLATTTLIIVACASALYFTENTPPVAYERFVKAVLSGEVDEHMEAERLLERIGERSPVRADQLSLVVRTFELRRKTNLESNATDVASSRLLVRALSADSDLAWTEHPLRKHGLGEALSLFSESIRKFRTNSDLELGQLEPTTLSDDAIEYYTEVAHHDDSRLTPEQLRASALNNIGNIYFYRGNYREALEAWTNTIERHPDYRNAGTLANMVAAHVVLNDYDAAIRLGQDSRLWAEENGKDVEDTAHYVSILVNTGLSFIAAKQIESSIPLLEVSALIAEDDSSKLDLALAYAMNAMPDRAEQVLRQLSAPISHTDTLDDATFSPENRCSHLIWALHSTATDPRDIAARLLVFRDERRSVSEMQLYADEEQLKALRQSVADGLLSFPGSCSSYGLVPSIVDFIAGR